MKNVFLVDVIKMTKVIKLNFTGVNTDKTLVYIIHLYNLILASFEKFKQNPLKSVDFKSEKEAGVTESVTR